MADWLVTGGTGHIGPPLLAPPPAPGGRGGAGYIGAHVVDALHAQGERAVVIDDLSTGGGDRAGDAVFVEGSILDEDLVRRTLAQHDVRGIIHIAAKKQVGESIALPSKSSRLN